MKLILVEIRESKTEGYALAKYQEQGVAIPIPGFENITTGGRTLWQAIKLNGDGLDELELKAKKRTEVTLDDKVFRVEQSKWTRTDDDGNKSEVTSNWIRVK
jgi:hypothetical protein